MDCGGADCATRCLVDEGRAKDGDCSTGRCDLMTKLCHALTASESPAADNTNSPIQNFWETDIDCGGPDCTSCGETAPNNVCAANMDCISKQCESLVCTSCFN